MIFKTDDAVDSIWGALRERDAEEARYAEAFVEDERYEWPWWNHVEGKWEF